MSKRIFCVVVVLLVAISLMACNTDTEKEVTETAKPAEQTQEKTEATAEAPGEEPVSLDVDFMFNLESESDAKGVAVNLAVERLKVSNPNIEIVFNTVGHDDYQTKILTQAASGDLPDVFNVKGSWLKNMVTNELIGSMDEYFDNDADWYAQFIPGALQDMIYDGKIWGAPFQMLTTSVIYYNETIFAEAGYDEFPATWDEFVDCLTKIKDLGYTPISMGNKGLWVANSCYFSALGDRTAGEEWFNGIMANDGSASFNDPEIILAMDKFLELEQIGAFNEDMNSIDNSQQRTAYYNGEAACYLEGNWSIADMIVSCPEDVLDNTGFAVLPTVAGGAGEGGKTSGGSAWGNAYSASLEGAQLEAAITFIKLTTDNDYGTDLLNAGDLPGVLVPEYDYSQMHPFLKEYLDFRATLGISHIYDVYFDTSVIDAMNVGFQEVLTGQITPAQWGENVQAEYEMMP